MLHPTVCTRTCHGAPTKLQGVRPARRSAVIARWATRIAEMKAEDASKDFKIREIAQVMRVAEEHVQQMVAIRPGLLLMDSIMLQQRVRVLASKHAVPEQAVAAAAVQNPHLLFDA